MKNIITPIIISALILSSCSEEKRLVRKAANAIDQSDYDKALSYYDQALARDSNSFRANAGKGIVLSEFMGRYDKAIPYLEKALKKSPEETSVKINSDLGKSYHYVGNYPRALYHYGKITADNKEDNPYYDALLSKRIADCKFAMEHPQVAPPEEQYAKNVGTAINSDFPEYGPVYTNSTMIFTAKRKDTPKEKKNNIDGRYFESMYISSYTDGNFSTPRRYTIPDLGENSSFHSGNESAVSVLEDGKTLYLFKGGELYAADLTNPTKEPDKLSGKANFLDFHPYACVTNDGKTMFLVSESVNNGGGTDIYQSFKKEDGSWSRPMLLPFNINTEYNEDAPYMSEDGTLFFASNGLPGYGGYDIYKTRYVNGEWTTPVNIGQPINTPADEIYFTLNPGSSNGYYASNRMGGYGDMDIYGVHYVSMDMPECTTTDTLFATNESPANEPLAYKFSAGIPEQYKGQVRSVTWKINDVTIAETGEQINYVFDETGTYKVSAKAIILCDDCPALIAVCSEKEINTGLPTFVSTQTEKPDATSVPKVEYTSPVAVGELNNSQLISLGWNTNPCYFDYDESALREESKELLNQNIRVLKANRDLSLVINGYADARGTDGYNKDLSAQRIYSVRQYLVQNGISAGRITAITAYGESRITNGCVDDVECTEEQHQENRKVDFKVSNNRVLYTRVSFRD
ncbi:MAG: hypothetical protein K0S33_640 [Bacteroidetes bacterium]|nr:hypothetical protein [Bacteroidota bacterium]